MASQIGLTDLANLGVVAMDRTLSLGLKNSLVNWFIEALHAMSDEEKRELLMASADYPDTKPVICIVRVVE